MEKKYNPTGETYKIETVNDFMQVVTEENLEYLIADFKSTLRTGLEMNKLMSLVASTTGQEVEKLSLPCFQWIDDGKHDIVGITISAHDDPSVRLEIKKKERP